MRLPLVLAIFGGALALRLWGIGFGLPETYHPDEPAYVLQALAIARGLPNGLTFADPPLFKYVLLAEYAGAYGIDRLLGSAHSAQEFADQFRADPTRLYLIARASSAVFGALTVLAAAALGRQVGGRRTAVLAAVLTGVAYLLVRDAHFGVNDTLVTLLVTLGLLFCVRVAAEGRRRDYVAAGTLTGLAFAAKYDGLVLLVPLLLAHLGHIARVRAAKAANSANARPADREANATNGQDLGGTARASLLAKLTSWGNLSSTAIANLGLSFGAIVIAAVVAFPSLVTEPGRVLNDIYLHLYLSAAGGYDGLDPAGGYPFYASALVTGIGIPLTATAAAGIGLSFARRHWSALLVASLPVVLVGVLGSQRLYFARFLLPALPALLVEASLALDALIRRQVLVGALAAIVVTAPTLIDALRFDNLLIQTDTRTLASQWIRTQLPAGAAMAVDAPPLGPTLADAPQRIEVANDWSLFDLTPADYAARGTEYIVVSSFTAEARAIDPQREARRVAFNQALQSEARLGLVAQFRPYAGDAEPPFAYDAIYAPYSALDRLDRPGPTITVYRLTR